MIYLPEKVTKYLAKYSQPNWNLEITDISKINFVIVIPAISEYANIILLLESLLKNDNKYFTSTLIIFVINNSASANEEVKEDNKKSLELIRSLINKRAKTELTIKVILSGLRFGLVDASTRGKEFPEKDAGVGFARKVGMDLALTVFDYSTENKKLIISLDSDCKVQNNYITEVIENFIKNNYSAAVIKFQHDISENETANAIICYEIFLRYYVLGLKLANSPYAFHAVGSTMVFDYETYIKAEGMNKRKAAEDFYFLEKIAKRTEIKELKSTTVYPSSRSSWRVPFGTGQRVNRFLNKVQNEYLLYDQKSFLILKDWLVIFNDAGILSSKEYLNIAKNIHGALYQFLIISEFENSWNKILINSKSVKQLEKQKVNLFDGFKTLKLIHYLRDEVFPLINMFDALDNILPYFNYSYRKKRKANENPELEDQIIYLNILRELT
jgi:hypothetical protein